MGRLKSVAVLGLGAIGTAIARSCVAAGHPVVVWNRSIERTAPLVEEGAGTAETAGQAAGAAELSIMCVSGYSAVNEILQDEAVTGALAGKPLCQLSDVSETEAIELDERLSGLGVGCLFGSVLGMPSDIERREGTIVCSGSHDLFNQAEQILTALGDVIYAGSDASAAYTLAQLTYPANFGLTLGYLHGAAMADSLGIPIEAYTDLCLSRLPGLRERLRGFAPLLAGKDFAPHQARLKTWAAAFERYLEMSQAQKADDTFPSALMHILQGAIEQGHGDNDITSVFATMRHDSKSLR